MFDDIFSTLSKYNSATNENYLTEAFVYVLRQLLERDCRAGIAILNKLCFNDDGHFDPNEKIEISTQVLRKELGKPDIKISSPNKLIYIEVKYESGLGERQLERYFEIIKSSPATIKRVCMLTRYAIDFDELSVKPNKHVRWYEVHDWLSKVKVEDPISKYLIKEFTNFLEVKQMSIQKIGWEYIRGVPALLNLIDMIEVAIKGASLSGIKSAGQEWNGFYIQNKKFWCGIIYDNPLLLVFEIEDKKFGKKKVEGTSYPFRVRYGRIQFLLDLESVYFFSLDKDKQFEEITKFIRKSHEDAEKIIAK